MRDTVEQAALELVAQRCDLLRVDEQGVARDFRGFAQAYNSGYVFRTGPESALVMATVKKLADACAAANVESADAFGPVEFVAGEREQIDVQRVHVEGKFSGGLDSVGVEINFVFFGDAADFFERLDGPQLVVGVHHGEKDGFGADRSSDSFGIDAAFAIDAQIGDADPLFFGGLARVQDGFVFDGGGDDVGWCVLRRVHSQDWLCHSGAEDTEDGVVIGFGAAAGEDDLLGASTDQRGNLLAGGFDGGAGALTGRVDGGGVGKVGREIREHGVEDLGVDGRRGVVVEIDAVHRDGLSILRGDA